MNFHEYQAKQLFADYGIAVPAGRVASSADEAVEAAKSLGNGPWMVKAQIHAGGRGKAGGVKFCKTTDDVQAAAGKMLGTKMATYQSAGVALPVNQVLVTTAGEIVKELYLSLLVDRDRKAITYIVSSEGGVDIEEVAANTPEKIHTLVVDYAEGVQPYQGREIGFKMGLTAKQSNQLAGIMGGLYKLFNEKDLSLVELNPLAILDDGSLYALDGKVNSDDNATFRHKDLAAMRDTTQEDETEVKASEHDLNYVTMDGNIGC
ncbi:MAG TPA: ATP-grasp domain-containing protein, partial [Thermomonas sp.]